jgi:ABC-type bacteriocin/lantibiotic exporter with double-glycine peptidase domain
MTRTLTSVLLAALALAGCAVYPGTARPTTYEELRRETGWTLVESVPFVPQESGRDCGAAATSMVLARWGVDVPARDLEAECAVPGQEGLKASALRDAARRRGLSAFVFPGRVADLEHELGRGRPVVVGLLKTLGPLATSHFVVVVGLHPGSGKVAALDPARGLVRDTLEAFGAEWVAAKGVAMVVFRPATVSMTGGAR